MYAQSIFDLLVTKPDVANAVAAIGSAVLAAVAVLISFVSLFVSHATLRHQRLHNRLSVRPLAYFAVGDYEDDVFVKLQNNGVGPLIIRRVRVLGAEVPDKPLVECMPELAPGVPWTTFTGDLSGRSLQPGSELMLLQLCAESAQSMPMYVLSRSGLRRALGQLSLEIEYTDIYESKLPSVCRDLDWFRRGLGIEREEART